MVKEVAALHCYSRAEDDDKVHGPLSGWTTRCEQATPCANATRPWLKACDRESVASGLPLAANALTAEKKHPSSDGGKEKHRVSWIVQASWDSIAVPRGFKGAAGLHSSVAAAT